MIINHVHRELLDDLRALEAEASMIYSTVVLPNWDGPMHGFGRTLHAYMMALLARIDLASSYWRGNEAQQSERMTAFMNQYVCQGTDVAKIIVQVWRHKLMHTAKPRRLARPNNGSYYWLLHWSEHLPRDVHLTFVDSNGTRILNIGMLYLLADIRDGFEKYFNDLASSEALRANARQMQSTVQSYRYKP